MAASPPRPLERQLVPPDQRHVHCSPNSEDRWRGKGSQEVRLQGDLLYHCACVLFLAYWGFCVFALVLTKGLSPAAWKLNSVLDHFILLSPFQQNGQNHQLRLV